MNPAASELLQLNQRLLDSIAAADWAAYEQLCDPGLTAFEPEARGQLVEGLDFDRFYFDLGATGAQRTTLCSPRVRILGDVGLASYVRLVQRLDPGGAPETAAFEETRVWHRQAGCWRLLHFHRSAVGFDPSSPLASRAK